MTEKMSCVGDADLALRQTGKNPKRIGLGEAEVG